MNVFLDDDAVLIDLELPGKTAKDVDLSLENGVLTVTIKKRAESQPKQIEIQ